MGTIHLTCVVVGIQYVNYKLNNNQTNMDWTKSLTTELNTGEREAELVERELYSSEGN